MMAVESTPRSTSGAKLGRDIKTVKTVAYHLPYPYPHPSSLHTVDGGGVMLEGTTPIRIQIVQSEEIWIDLP